MENLIKFLKNRNQTISCMESCTGGMLSNEITNIDGSSDVFNVGLVTYSNNWKEYFGVNKETIETYTVYSIEVAKEMAKAVSNFAKSDWGIGITGQLGKKDLKNNSNKLNTVYFAIYDKNSNKSFNYILEPVGENKFEKKQDVIKNIKERFYEICKWEISRI